MKILFCGDKHLKITRFDLAKRCLSWINEVIEKEKPDMYVCLGDDMDSHAVLRSEIMCEYRRHIDFVMSKKIKMVYILGNHDFYNPKDSTYHAFQSLIGINKNFKVVDKRFDLGNITFVPYLPDHTKFPLDTKEICVTHQTFIGADYGYMRPEVGVDAALVKANVIISGHVHLRQEFGKVVYPGTPYAQNANDINQSKGVLLFDTETYDKKFISSTLPFWLGSRHEINSEYSIDMLHEELSKILTPNDHWIVEITGPRAEIMQYMNSKRFQDIKKNIDIQIKTKFTDKNKRKIEIDALSMEHIIKEYITKVYDGNLNKDDIIKKAIDIYKKVQ